MEYQKYTPEGWYDEVKPITRETLDMALINGDIMEARVTKCDHNYNLHLDFGSDAKGIIPREEIEAINVDETGFPKPNICVSKVNKIVQFKVKDITKDDIFVLSRRLVSEDALSWIKTDLKEGSIVDRNSKKY